MKSPVNTAEFNQNYLPTKNDQNMLTDISLKICESSIIQNFEIINKQP